VEGRGKGLVNYLQLARADLCMAFESHELSLQNLNAIGQSLLQISKFRSSTVYSNQDKPITSKNDDIMTIYFFAISRIRNLVGLCGILSLINADSWNAAVDPRKLQVIHLTLPSSLH